MSTKKSPSILDKVKEVAGDIVETAKDAVGNITTSDKKDSKPKSAGTKTGAKSSTHKSDSKSKASDKSESKSKK